MASSRTARPMTSIAVPGSLRPGESARLAISVSTTAPKRGSWSNERTSPIVKHPRIADSWSSPSRPSARAMAMVGSTKAPGMSRT